jgi:hypothetical protein
MDRIQVNFFFRESADMAMRHAITDRTLHIVASALRADRINVLFPPRPHPRVHRIADRIAEQIKREHDQEDRQRYKRHFPPDTLP